MSLEDHQFNIEYRSGRDDIVRELFRPALSVSTEYWRAVGFFSSSSLETLGAPLAVFLQSGGRIRLICSVKLREDDIEAINQGLSRRAAAERRLDAIVDEDFHVPVGNGVALLGQLVELGRLEIKIALPRHGNGIFHEKVGVFIDGERYVAFAGSSNESRTAFEDNYECIDVFPSWSEPTRAQAKRAHFEALWEQRAEGVDVFAFPNAVLKKLLKVIHKGPEPSPTPPGQTNQTSTGNKWRHQDDAMESFLNVKRGVLNMATGTGKTRTALKILDRLLSDDLIDSMIISTDGSDLLNQWYRTLLEHHPSIAGNPLRFYRQYDTFHESLDYELRPVGSALLVSRYHLASALKHLSDTQASRTLLVHDEVHGLGSPGNRQNLGGKSDAFRYRLGLSATPERDYDEQGNRFVEREVGPVCFEFSLEDAILRGILAPFHYYALEYEPTAEDRERVAAVYRREAARKRAGNPMSKEELWTELAKVHKTSRAKLPLFREFIADHQDLLERSIVFAETTEYGREVLEIVHDFRPDFHTYFSGEDAETLKRFARGDLECLVACHRLSEGIDIQSLKSVILFSSARARLETIQRMGRCLRYDPNHPKKIAAVVDFVRQSGDKENADQERAEWLRGLSNVRPKGWS